MIYDAIIIGLGASGLAASIYAKRSGLNIAVINFSVPGGIINESSIVENYPGFKSISGPDLAYEFFEHFNSLDVPLFNEEVIDIKDGEIKKVITNSNVYETKNVIICSGRKPKKLNLPNEDKYIGNGISYCALCDGNLYKGKNVCIVGGGNSALESAIYLSNICNKIYLLVRSDKLRGQQFLIEDVSSKENIIVIYNALITDILEDNNKITGVMIDDKLINIDAIFVNVGYEPSVNILKSLDLNMDGNYILVDKNMETNLKGIFACGDIIKKDLYQLVTAVSDGAIAANYIFKNMKKR